LSTGLKSNISQNYQNVCLLGLVVLILTHQTDLGVIKMSAKIELHTTSKQIRDIIGGAMYVVCEPRIFAYMEEFCPQYSHGSWQFASINGAPFMYPKMGTEAVTLSNPNNYSENEVSPEAAGFAICTMVFNHLANRFQSDALCKNWEMLMDNIEDMPFSSEILAFLD
jgi:hypothetical protein